MMCLYLQPGALNRIVAGMQRSPNVLFITVDQWRAECLSYLDHPVVQTPNLDRLAERGVLFRNHFAQSAPCGPSRASLYTGMYAMNHRSVLNGTPLDRRHTNIALEARAAGYDPVLFGYTDTSVDPRGVVASDPRLFTYEGVLPGFHALCDLPESNPQLWLRWMRDSGEPVDPDGDWRAFVDEPVADYSGCDEWGIHRAPTQYQAQHSQTTFLTNEVLRYLDTQGDAPWFAHVSYLRPHPPFFAPEPFNTMYNPESVPMPVRAATDEQESATHPLLAMVLGVEWISGPRNIKHIQQLRATYYAMQTEVDQQLGRLFDWLDANDQAQNTIVVVTSDHGEQLCDHYLTQKLGFFDQSYHVPLIISDPRSAFDSSRGRVVESFTENVDVTPTILELLEIEIPVQCDGRSLKNWFTPEPPAHWREEVHWEWDQREPADRRFERSLDLTMEELSLCVLRDAHGKYVQFGGHGTLPHVFFDLDNDPHELHNVAADPAYASQILDYAQRMLAWRMRHAERTLSGTKVTGIGLVSHRAERR